MRGHIVNSQATKTLCRANVNTRSHNNIAPSHEINKKKLITEKCFSYNIVSINLNMYTFIIYERILILQNYQILEIPCSIPLFRIGIPNLRETKNKGNSVFSCP